MRNTSDQERGTWATYIQVGRERAQLNKSEFGRRVGVDRATVLRWETGRNRPDDGDLVARVAAVLGIDLDEALAAAGLRPGVEPPAEPTQELDEEVEMILRADVDQRTKEEALEQLHRMRIRDRQRRMEDIEALILRARRSA